MKRTLLAVVVAALAVGFARADWEFGDAHKMHFPQNPDPLGWDVAVITPNPPPPAAVADDWLCTQSGAVSDLHIWFSMRQDLPPQPGLVAFSIWSDVPATPNMFSHPGNLLWGGIFGPAQYSIRPYLVGVQGWYDPNDPQGVIPQDHNQIWQLNLTQIPQPFWQERGTIYWLGVNFAPDWVNAAGWKTSKDHFNDDAVWWNWQTGGWHELRDPLSGESLDMAFVITPEPGTVYGAALLLGFAGWHWYRKHRRV
jgi:hypothetical protein